MTTSDARKRLAELVAHNHGIDPSCSERMVGACLVVIDPEDREQVKRLLAVMRDKGWTGLDPDALGDMRAALREFANPTPPKPEEPTGLGAVVEEANGVLWTRAMKDDQPWTDAIEGEWRDYSQIEATRVLSDGVQR